MSQVLKIFSDFLTREDSELFFFFFLKELISYEKNLSSDVNMEHLNQAGYLLLERIISLCPLSAVLMVSEDFLSNLIEGLWRF